MKFAVVEEAKAKLQHALEHYRRARAQNDVAVKEHETVAKKEKAAADELVRVIEDVVVKLNN